MILADQLKSDDLRYVRGALIIEHSLKILLAFWQQFCPDLFGLRVGLLELLEPQPYSINACFMRAFVAQLKSDYVLELSQLRQNMGSADEDLVQWEQVFFGIKIEAQEAGPCQKRLQPVNYLHVFGLGLFILILIPLKKTKESVCSSIGFSLLIINPKVILREFLGPTDLTRAQALGVYESTQVIMVGEDEDFIFATLQLVTLEFKSFNDGQKFTVVGLVPCFG